MLRQVRSSSAAKPVRLSALSRSFVSLKPQSSQKTGKETQKEQDAKPSAFQQYYRYFWEPLIPSRFRNKRYSVEEQRQRLSVESDNISTLMKDIREFNKTQGKYYDSIVDSDKSILYQNIPFPVLEGCLDVKTGEKVSLPDRLYGKESSLVIFSFREMGNRHAEKIKEAWREKYQGSEEKHPCYHVIVVENRLLLPFKSIHRRTLASNPKYANSLLHYGPIPEIRLKLGMINSLIGWAYVVDCMGQIKMNMHGALTENETRAM